jgi:hypothetical protein
MKLSVNSNAAANGMGKNRKVLDLYGPRAVKNDKKDARKRLLSRKHARKPKNNGHRAIALLERAIEAQELWSELSGFEFPDFDEHWDDSWWNAGEDGWRDSNEYHSAVNPKIARDCAVCEEEMVDELTDARTFPARSATLSYKDAFLSPRPTAKRDLSQLEKRAKLGNEVGCCVTCVVKTIAMTFANNPTATTVTCPRRRCCAQVGLTTIRAFLKSGQVAEATARPLLLHVDELALRQTALGLEERDSAASFVPCQGAFCRNEFLVLFGASECSLVTCNECKFHNCVVCRGAYHFGRTCKQVLASQPSLVWRQENTRACPRCHVAIEKNNGCDHMHCKCGLDFSWQGAEAGIFGLEKLSQFAVRHERAPAPLPLAAPQPAPAPAAAVSAVVRPCAFKIQEPIFDETPIYMRSIRI